MLLTVLLILSIVSIIYFYLISISNEKYWKKRNIPYYGGKNVLAFWSDYLLSDKPLIDIIIKIKQKYPGVPAIAVANLQRPTLIIRDLTNMKHILTQDFKSFVDRSTPYSSHDLLADNLVFMKGMRWKLTRQKLTPIFTSAKLRNMFYIMNKSAKDYIEHLRKEKPIDAYDSLTEFTCAAVTASIFGVSTGSTFDSPFRDIARSAITPSMKSNLKAALNGAAPAMFSMLGLKIFGDNETEFVSAMKNILKLRKSENVKKHDFADLALTLQQNGPIKDEETGCTVEPTDAMLAAQAFVFLVAGVDPTAAALFFALYEIAKNPELQNRLRNETDSLFESENGDVNFDVVNKQDYLDNVLDEAMRLYPPTPIISRLSTENTTLPAGNIQLEKGAEVIISIYDLHHNPELFPNPEVFDPSRFPDAKSNPFYMPFGGGARICIGNRYARIQMKTGLFHILRNFNIRLHSRDEKVRFQKMPFALRSDNIDFRFEPRTDIFLN